jgi:hypothetical protein
MVFTCNVCRRQFKTRQGLTSHISNPGQAHSSQPRPRRPAPVLPRGNRIEPPAVLTAPVNTTRLRAQFKVSALASRLFDYHVFPLSGTNTADADHTTAVPALAADAQIQRIELEYRGKLASNLRWAAVISDNHPAASLAVMSKILENGGLGSHDAKTAFSVYNITGPPIKCAPTTPRYLYVTYEMEAGVVADAADFTILVDVLGAAASLDHLSL